MRRALQLLPLLGLAPLGHFLSAYLGGAGLLRSGDGILIGLACMFLLPWAVAASFLMVKVAWPARLLFFIGAMVVQGVLLFTVIPAGATSEMMGIARRLRREFPPDQIRTCAATLLQKQHDGILAVRQEKRDQGTVLVDDSELPIPLRGKFERVFIEEQRVYFSLNRRTGILCDSRKHVREFSECSMADGVHAYRYERQ